jgi:hypothetical protein
MPKGLQHGSYLTMPFRGQSSDLSGGAGKEKGIKQNRDFHDEDFGWGLLCLIFLTFLENELLFYGQTIPR